MIKSHFSERDKSLTVHIEQNKSESPDDDTAQKVNNERQTDRILSSKIRQVGQRSVSVIVNLFTLLKLLRKRMPQQNDIDETELKRELQKYIGESQLFRSVKSMKFVAEFSNGLQMKNRLTFEDSQQMQAFVKWICSQGLQDALELTFSKSCNSENCNLKQLKQLDFSQKGQPIHPTNISRIKLGQNYSKQSKDQILIPKRLSTLTQAIISSDMIAFKRHWLPLSECFQQAITTWDVNRYYYEAQLRRLIQILEFRIEKFTIKYPNISSADQIVHRFSIYEFLYPKIERFLSQLKHKIKINSWKLTESDKKMSIFDHMMLSFIKQADSFPNKDIFEFFIDMNQKKLQLRKIINELLELQLNKAECADAINSVIFNIRKMRQQQKQSQKNMLKERLQKQCFKKETKYHPQFKPLLSNDSCIGCIRAFIEKEWIPYPQNHQTVLLPQASQIKSYESQIKQKICDMLNNQGGVIMFNCKSNYARIYPIGAQITQKEKEAIENRLNSLLSSVYPRPQLSKNIVISFVPLAISIETDIRSFIGSNNQLKPYQLSYKHEPLVGQYVLRVKVCPTNSSIVYIWQNQKQVFHLAGFKNQTKPKRIHKLIKLRWKKYLQNQKKKFRPTTFGNPLNHNCKIPSSGKVTAIESTVQVPPREYDHVSLLIIGESYLEKFRQTFARTKIQFKLEQKFKQRQFKTAKNTAALYYNQKFDNLRNIFSSKEYDFGGKKTTIIAITDYLKLNYQDAEQVVKKNLLNKANQLLREEYPSRSLQIFQFRRPEQIQYFIKTGDKQSNLLIYYFFCDNKCKLWFKNPQELDRMSPEERTKLFLELNYQNESKYIQSQSNKTTVQSIKENFN